MQLMINSKTSPPGILPHDIGATCVGVVYSCTVPVTVQLSAGIAPGVHLYSADTRGPVDRAPGPGCQCPISRRGDKYRDRNYCKLVTTSGEQLRNCEINSYGTRDIVTRGRNTLFFSIK